MSPYTSKESVKISVLLAAAFFSFFVPLAVIPLTDADEGAFSEASREMIRSGNWLFTYLNGQPRFDKPILFYWFQALSLSVFGLNEAAARLPSALAAFLWAGSVWYYTKKYFTADIAFRAAFFLIMAVQVSVIAKAAIADSLLNLFLTLSMFMLMEYIREHAKRFLNGLWFFMALGFLTKGPIAVLIPSAAVILWYIIKKDYKGILSIGFHPPGILIFLLTAGPWYAYAFSTYGWEYFDGFFMKHNVERFSDSLEGHAGSLVYYMPVVLAGVLPFTWFLIRALQKLPSDFKSAGLPRFLWIWAVFVTVFFSLSGTKLPHYAVYGYTPLFILMAVHYNKKDSDYLMYLPPFVFLLTVAFIPDILTSLRPGLTGYAGIAADALIKVFLSGPYKTLMILAGVYLMMMFLLPLFREWKLIASGFIFSAAVHFVILPAAAEALQRPVYEAALKAKQAGIHAVLWKVYYPSWSFYTDRITEYRLPEEGDYVLTTGEYLYLIDEYTELYSKHGIHLIQIKKIDKTLEWHLRERGYMVPYKQEKKADVQETEKNSVRPD